MIYFYVGVKIENQINMGNQNSQQIDQNPINQQLIAPEKHEINYWMISTIILLAIAISCGVYIVILRNQINTANSTQNSKLGITPVPTIMVPTGTPVPTPSTPATGANNTEWQTYQSKRFSIQFRYPSKYVLENEYENTYPDQGFIHLYTQEGYELVKSKAPRGGPDFIQVGAYSNPKNLTPIEWAKSDTAHSNFTGQYETINIAGENGLSYTFEGMGSGDTRVIAHNGYIYTFDVMGDSTMRDDFKRILSTVAFIQ